MSDCPHCHGTGLRWKLTYGMTTPKLDPATGSFVSTVSVSQKQVRCDHV